MNNKIFFYHGTDARIVQMSAEKRNSLHNFCKLVATQLRPYFPANILCLDLFKKPLDYESNPTPFLNLQNALTLCDGILGDSPLYNYDHFSITNSRERAKNYAYRSFAFGEIGLMAYRMLDVCLQMGLTKWGPYPLKEFCKELLDFAEAEPEPVVFEFDDLDINDIENENGEKVSSEMVKRLQDGDSFQASFRYNKDVELNLDNAIYLRK